MLYIVHLLTNNGYLANNGENIKANAQYVIFFKNFKFVVMRSN